MRKLRLQERKVEILSHMAQTPVAGSRWLRRNGKHANAEVEVVDTNGLSVQFINRGGGAATGNQKIDDSKQYALAYDTFMTQYVARESVSTNGGGHGFRQRNGTKPKPVDDASVPLSLNGVDLVAGLGLPFTVELVDISPALAKAWMDRGGQNRMPTRTRIVRLTNVIRRGEWQVDGNTIKLDKDGLVIDGQHRLLACIAAGLSIRSLVVRGVDRAVFPVLDTGKSRTPADVMGIAGYRNRVAIASNARSLILFEASGRLDPPNHAELAPLHSHTALLQYANDHPDVEDGVLLANQVRGHGLSGGAGLLGTLFTLLLRANRDQAYVFAEHLGSGANLDSDNPILKYRNRLISDKRMPNGLADREHLVALGIKAWNFWRAGERVGQLTWHAQRGAGTRGGEDFPTAV